jgi:hypothetical protein
VHLPPPSPPFPPTELCTLNGPPSTVPTNGTTAPGTVPRCTRRIPTYLNLPMIAVLTPAPATIIPRDSLCMMERGREGIAFPGLRHLCTAKHAPTERKNSSAGRELTHYRRTHHDLLGGSPLSGYDHLLSLFAVSLPGIGRTIFPC